MCPGCRGTDCCFFQWGKPKLVHGVIKADVACEARIRCNTCWNRTVSFKSHGFRKDSDERRNLTPTWESCGPASLKLLAEKAPGVLEDLPYVCASRQMRITHELDVVLKANLTSANRVGTFLEEWRHEWVEQRQHSNLGRCWSLDLRAPNAAPGPAPADRPAESTAQPTLVRSHGFTVLEQPEARKPVAAFLEEGVHYSAASPGAGWIRTYLIESQEKVQASQERLGFQLTAGCKDIFWDANKKVLWYQGRGFSMSDLVVMQTMMSSSSIPILCYAATSDSMDNPATVLAFADMIAGYERLKELNYPSMEAANAALTGSCTVDNKFVVQEKMYQRVPPLQAKRDAILAQNASLRIEGKEPEYSGATAAAAAAAATSPGNPRGLPVLDEEDEDLEDTDAVRNECSANHLRRASSSAGFVTDVTSAYSINLRLVEQLWECGRDGETVTLSCLDKPQRRAMYQVLQSKYAGRIDFDKDDSDVLFKPIEIKRIAQQGTRVQSSTTQTREQLYQTRQKRELLEEFLKTIDPNWNADLMRQDAWHFLDVRT